MLFSGVKTAGAGGCVVPSETPTLHVEIDASHPVIDHTKQRVALKNFDIATISPYGHEQNVHVNGLMRGSITTETKMGIAWQRLSNGEDNCHWFNTIDLTLKLSPTIFIASEIPETTCLYREVLKHEYTHYKTDLQIAQDYQAVFQQEIANFMRQTGVIGPFPAAMQPQAKQELVRRLEAVVHIVSERMNADRIRRQALIDTREEYERVVRACPGDRGAM